MTVDGAHWSAHVSRWTAAKSASAVIHHVPAPSYDPSPVQRRTEHRVHAMIRINDWYYAVCRLTDWWPRSDPSADTHAPPTHPNQLDDVQKNLATTNHRQPLRKQHLPNSFRISASFSRLIRISIMVEHHFDSKGIRTHNLPQNLETKRQRVCWRLSISEIFVDVTAYQNKPSGLEKKELQRLVLLCITDNPDGIISLTLRLLGYFVGTNPSALRVCLPNFTEDEESINLQKNSTTFR